MNVEIWKPVTGYEKLYEVSNIGRVKSLERIVISKKKSELPVHQKILSYRISNPTQRHPMKRLSVELWKNNKRKVETAARLVGYAFIENPKNKPQINHIDGNPLNNNVENLEWVTASENNLHAHKNHFITARRKPVQGVHNKTAQLVEFESLTAAAAYFMVTKNAINAAIHGYGRSKGCKGYKWKYMN